MIYSTRHKPLLPNKGFTLVELLVTMAISGAFVVGLMQMIVNNARNYQVQNAVAQMQEDGSFIGEALNREVRRAGYITRNPHVACVQPLCAMDSEISAGLVDGGGGRACAWDGASCLPNIDLFDQGEYIKGASDNGGMLDNTSDSFMFRYQVEDQDDLSATLCGSDLTFDAGAEEDYVNVLLVGFYVDSRHILRCVAKLKKDVNVDGVYNTDAGEYELGTNMPLISNVENMRVLYGLDTDNDSNHSANLYMDATSTANANAWTQVVSVRISLVMRSDDKNIAVGNADTYSINGTTLTTISPGEGRLFQVFSTTVALRNKVL
ncbi:MAG: prepilin-type N-terminal cleavage/methylation domain-containing protein [Methylococcaceae bacterium]|nr:MAG: prepilin-type N-terminal cleavage/methylation domain-containing protein [Methylococcaceae bacterium]